MTIKTVLEYVQSAMIDIGSDGVNSISDTEESLMISSMLRDCYDELMMRDNWSFLRRPITLTSLSDPTKPTSFTIPSGTRFVEKLYYNISETGGFERREIEYLDPDTFLERTNSNTNSNTVVVTDGVSIQFTVVNDRWPMYWTTFDDNVIHLDAYPANLLTTLTTGRITAVGFINPEFEIEDEFVPDLPEHLVPLLQASLTSVASLNVKQQQNPASERKATRQLARLRRNESRTQRDGYYRNRYGRR